MESIVVTHSHGSYEITFVTDLHSLTCDAIITDRNVQAALSGKLPSVPALVLEPGEPTKSLSEFERSLRWLAQNGIKRNHTIAAVGGGVIGDLGGYVAASYMRGIRYVQVPTSLLAMVDSSVGGKVGIDIPEGKNLVGAFYPPAEVILYQNALATLPREHFVNGMAEVLKYGFISDPSILNETEPPIRRCIDIKANVVAADEFDTTGLRAILNFGHTIGHALEAGSGYQLLHGEAISIGMVLESRLGEALGLTEPGTSDVVAECLNAAGLPVSLPPIPADQIMALMRNDKKATASGIGFSLLTSLGRCKLVESVPEDAILAVLKSP
ncbi:MAG: 3-dehydroquinate synthase [Fimbriimonadaceae bacterium]